MAKISGTAFFYVDGVQYKLRGNMTVSLGGFERETVNGLDGYHGIKEKPMNSVLECDLTDTPDLDLNVLESATDVTVIVELINGKRGVINNATQMNHLTLNVEDGKYTVKFEGPQGQWLTAAVAA